MQTIDKPLENGSRILVEFGRAKTPVYILFHDIPQNAKLLVDLSKLSPPERRIACPDVAKFMFDNYLNWEEAVEETATKFSWGHIFLLAHTTKVLHDERAHHKSLNALLAKGESVNYQMEAMFNLSEWNLVHLTVKAGEAQDDATRETVSRLFKGCPMLFDHMVSDLGVSTKEFHDIGLEYDDTYEIKRLCSDDPGANKIDSSGIYNRRPRPIAGTLSPSSMAMIAGSIETQATITPVVNEAIDSPTLEQVPGIQELAGIFKPEDGKSQGEASDDEWDVISVTSLDSSDSDLNEEVLLDKQTAEVYEDQTVTITSSQPAEDLANQLSCLVVQEEGLATEHTEQNVASQVESPFSDEGFSVLRQKTMPVDQKPQDPSPDDLPQTASEAGFDASHPEYVAGFVPKHDLPRTLPGSPVMVEAGGNKADAVSHYELEAAAPSPKRQRQKRNIGAVEAAWEVFGTKHARAHEPDKWYRDVKLRPHADRQVKEPSTNNTEKWPESLAVGAQPRQNLFEKCMTWSSKEGVFVDSGD
jgi:hypothetical protein